MKKSDRCICAFEIDTNPDLSFTVGFLKPLRKLSRHLTTFVLHPFLSFLLYYSGFNLLSQKTVQRGYVFRDCVHDVELQSVPRPLLLSFLNFWLILASVVLGFDQLSTSKIPLELLALYKGSQLELPLNMMKISHLVKCTFCWYVTLGKGFVMWSLRLNILACRFIRSVTAQERWMSECFYVVFAP